MLSQSDLRPVQIENGGRIDVEIADILVDEIRGERQPWCDT
jgi:hypothetical protein